MAHTETPFPLPLWRESAFKHRSYVAPGQDDSLKIMREPKNRRNGERTILEVGDWEVQTIDTTHGRVIRTDHHCRQSGKFWAGLITKAGLCLICGEKAPAEVEAMFYLGALVEGLNLKKRIV